MSPQNTQAAGKEREEECYPGSWGTPTVFCYRWKMCDENVREVILDFNLSWIKMAASLTQIILCCKVWLISVHHLPSGASCHLYFYLSCSLRRCRKKFQYQELLWSWTTWVRVQQVTSLCCESSSRLRPRRPLSPHWVVCPKCMSVRQSRAGCTSAGILRGLASFTGWSGTRLMFTARRSGASLMPQVRGQIHEEKKWTQIFSYALEWFNALQCFFSVKSFCHRVWEAQEVICLSLHGDRTEVVWSWRCRM